MVHRIGYRTKREYRLRVVALPIKTAHSRKYARLVVIGLRPAKINVAAVKEMMFVKQRPAHGRTEQLGLKLLVGAHAEGRMRLLVGINKRGHLLRRGVVPEARSVLNRIAQVLAHNTRMQARAELGGVFRTHDKVGLFAPDNIDRIHLIVRCRGILAYGIFVCAVQGTQRPRVAHGIRTVQLRVEIHRLQVKRIGRLHAAIIHAVSVALLELGKELFAQILEHVSI